MESKSKGEIVLLLSGKIRGFRKMIMIMMVVTMAMVMVKNWWMNWKISWRMKRM